MSVEVLLKGVTSALGEGPHWDAKSQSLLFVDIIEHTVYKWDSNTGNLESKTIGKLAGSIISSICKVFSNTDWPYHGVAWLPG